MAVSIALIILLGLCGDYVFRRLKLPGLVECSGGKSSSGLIC
ncbi:MAG: hypothetical protein U5R49_25585 [Deltaproteobacteria bacterium]|nr:hypothetical protein [Deltaproteobacteria bacterium]